MSIYNLLQTLAAFTFILSVVVLTYVTSELNRKGETYWQAAFLGPIIEILTNVSYFFQMPFL